LRVDAVRQTIGIPIRSVAAKEEGSRNLRLPSSLLARTAFLPRAAIAARRVTPRRSSREPVAAPRSRRAATGSQAARLAGAAWVGGAWMSQANNHPVSIDHRVTRPKDPPPHTSPLGNTSWLDHLLPRRRHHAGPDPASQEPAADAGPRPGPRRPAPLRESSRQGAREAPTVAAILHESRRLENRARHARSMREHPERYGRSTSGTVTLPSAF
jgi:hypothetical protein